jgi:hypothetical protein
VEQGLAGIGAVQLFARELDLAAGLQQAGQGLAGQRLGRVGGQGQAGVVLGAVFDADLEIEGAQGRVQVRRVGRQLQRSLEAALGVSEPLLADIGVAQGLMGRGLVGVQRRRQLQRRQRRVGR